VKIFGNLWVLRAFTGAIELPTPEALSELHDSSIVDSGFAGAEGGEVRLVIWLT
jgi:hypothetical protein